MTKTSNTDFANAGEGHRAPRSNGQALLGGRALFQSSGVRKPIHPFQGQVPSPDQILETHALNMGLGSVLASQYLHGRQSRDIYDPSSLRRTLRICSTAKGWSAHNSWVKARRCAGTNTVRRYFLRRETECNLSGFNLRAGLARKGNRLEVISSYSCRALGHWTCQPD